MHDFDMNIPSNYYTGYNPWDDFTNEDREIKPFELELVIDKEYVLCKVELKTQKHSQLDQKDNYIVTMLDTKEVLKSLTQEHLYDILFYIENYLD